MMASIDELFKGASSGTKRKLDAVQNPDTLYKQAKLNGQSDARTHGATVEDDGDDSGAEGPEMPAEMDEEGEGAGEDEDGRFFGGGVNRDTARAIAFLDQVDPDEEIKAEKIDEAWLRKLALSFEKKISKNAALRAKYPEDPSKFMTAEADLDSEIKALSVLAENPQLFPEFVRLGCVGSLTSLLAHENTDIAIDAMEIAAELIDDDVADTAPEAWLELVAALLEADLLDSLYQNLLRLDESSEADRAGVAHVLNCLSALTSAPTGANALAQHKELIPWLVKRTSKTDGDETNAQGAAEVLAALLQASRASRVKYIAADGIDASLQRLAQYRRTDPAHGSDEEEHVENMLDALIYALDARGGVRAFLDLEGIELAILLLNGAGKTMRARAIRLLDHVLTAPLHSESGAEAKGRSKDKGKGKADRSEDDGGDEAAVASAAATRTVEAAGLKPLFALLRRAKDAPTLEHALASIAALLRHLPAGSAARIRLLAKFVEKEYGAVQRLVQLRRRYAQAVATDGRSERPDNKADEEDEDEDALDAAERAAQHTYPLRLTDTVLAWMVAEDDGCRAAVTKELAERDETMAEIKAGLQGQLEDIEKDNQLDKDVDVDVDVNKSGEEGREGKDDEEKTLLNRNKVDDRKERARVKEMLQALVRCLE